MCKPAATKNSLQNCYKITVHKAHPNRVYAFAKACNHFAKTDKLDAKLLEKYAEFISKDGEVKGCTKARRIKGARSS
ncbi:MULTISPECIES: hypothetical protein [unclassified Wolbachia]|uniref:hypothetical protein n=1 Tax=unclassified Wolbachia TaxID=2640676 RepID=UPI002231814A|nr:hypothetical protein [Wolbachia endosymbiont (group A) of Apoderus coryli]